jgi:hypothetical protein
MQERLREIVLNPETEPGKAAQCASAWERLEARKAVLKGRPANTSQSIREPKQPKSKKPVVQPLDNLPEA